MTERERKMGKRLGELLRARGLTLKTVADACGVDVSTVHHWKKGSGMSNLLHLTRALQLLGANVDDLVNS